MPGQLVTMGETGSYLIGSTVNYDRSVSVTIDHEIVRSNANCAPRKSTAGWQFDETMFEELERGFETFTGLGFEQLIPAMERHQRTNIGAAMDAAPFVWALQHLRAAHARRRINLDDPVTNAALTRALLFGETMRVWGHHPRFAAIAKEACHPGSFYHTTGLFVLAAFLHDEGNRITFSIDDIAGQSKPDLYFRPSVSQQLFVEFKAPKVFTWRPSFNLTKELIAKKTREILASSRQINRQNPGVIAIMINHPSPEAAQLVLSEAAKFLRVEGRRKGSLAAVLTMHSPGVSRSHNAIGIESTMNVTLNAHWSHGDNPIRTNA